MPTLRSELEQRLGNWRDHLCPSWIDVLGTAEPAFSQVDSGELFDQAHPVFPNLEGNCRHVFSAFDRLTPTEVKVVLIGEDPYPDIDKATGRSFEQGDLYYWVPLRGDNHRVSCAMSLQSIVQQLATFCTGCPAYFESNGGWERLRRDIRQCARLNNLIPTPQALFDQWQNEGVLMLNTALTFTKKSQQRYHAKLWRPFVRAVISHLACCQTTTVFLCFGNKAWQVLGKQVQTTLKNRDLVVCRGHPSRKHLFLHGCNVFEDANAKLIAAGRGEVNWLPRRSSTACTDPLADSGGER